MKLTRDEAQDLLFIVEGEAMGNFHCLQKVILDHNRWAVTNSIIFKYLKDGKYYKVSYQQPATEMQSADPWFDNDHISCTEVQPIQKTITIFEPVL